MGFSTWDEEIVKEEFAKEKGGVASDYRIIGAADAGSTDEFAPDGAIGAAIKAGRTDGFADVGGDIKFALESQHVVYSGEGYRCRNATVMWIGYKLQDP